MLHAIKVFSTALWSSYVKTFSISDNKVLSAKGRIHWTKIHIPALNVSNDMTYSNTNKTEFIANSLRRNFTLNQDVVNLRIVDIITTKFEQFLNSNHDKTVNPAIYFLHEESENQQVSRS